MTALPPHGPAVSRFALFSLSALGDLLVAIPVLVHARRLYPDARVIVVCERAGTAALARELGIVDEVVLLRTDARRSPLGLLTNVRRVRSLSLDIAVQTLASNGSYGNLLLGATRAPVRCGFESGRFTNRLTHSVPVRRGVHYVTQNLDLLRRLGHYSIQDPNDRYMPPLEECSPLFAGASPRRDFGRYIVVSTGSDPRLAFKRWPDHYWADLARRLKTLALTCVFVGDAAEGERISRILGESGAGVNLAGRTAFADLAALIQHAELVVGTDGMVLHLAAAMKRDCLGLFGPTDHAEVGPFGDHVEILRLGLPCSPCYVVERLGQPINCRTHECMHFLSVDLVYDRLIRVLGSHLVHA